jgi:hypothetical protein
MRPNSRRPGWPCSAPCSTNTAAPGTAVASRLASAASPASGCGDVGRWQLLPLTRGQAGDGGDDTGRVHPPLRRARQRLQALGLPAGFAGALQFDAADLPELMPLWFWTARCRAAACGPYAGAPDLPLMASLCQYGFLHLEVYDTALLQRLDTLGPRCGWRLVQGPCPEAYAQGPAVTGRRLRT